MRISPAGQLGQRDEESCQRRGNKIGQQRSANIYSTKSSGQGTANLQICTVAVHSTIRNRKEPEILAKEHGQRI